MTIMGMRRDKNQPRRPMGGSRLRKVSKKQKRRTQTLHETFELVLQNQLGIVGFNECQAKLAGWSENPEHVGPLVPDHVGTRNQFNADRASNLQPLCYRCNSIKGSRRIDFRPPQMVEALKKLEVELESHRS